MSKKSSIIIAAAATIFSFFTIAWLSCNKPKQPYSCDWTVCENGGYCYQDTLSPHIPHCACPSGFEGPTCAIISVAKYIGTWDLREHIDWSDSAKYIGRDSSYTVLLEKTATNTTFFINNFFNDPYYDNIICNIDTLHTSHFTIDTLSNFHMFYDHYKINWGYGDIYANDSIIAHMFIRFKNKTSNWERDSVTIRLAPHHF